MAYRSLSRRSWIQAGLAGIGAGACGLRGGTAAPRSKPSILLLMADQFRADCLGAEKRTPVRTPNLDRIASQGARFRCAYTSVPSCTPARAGLLTGLSPWRHGMLGYGKVAERYSNEMPRMLADAGYHGVGIGKMHWAPQRNLHGFAQTLLDESGREESPDFVSDYRSWFRSQAPGLDPDATGIGWNDYDSKSYALPERLHPTRWTADTAVDFLRSYRGREPFFLKVSFARPHSPYDPPARYLEQYRDVDIPKAAVGSWAERHAHRGEKLPADTWCGDLGDDQVKRSRTGYFGSVTFIDEQIGRILAELDRRGRLDETLILFTADHGDMLGDHYLWRKTYAYESSARIPMIVRWPSGLLSAKRGQVRSEPVELRDVLPTLLDAAGATVDPEKFDGRSMLELVRGRRDGWREFIDLEHDVCYSPDNHWNALTDGRVKYVYHARDGRQQLFDLAADPGELRDLAGESGMAGTLAAWRSRLARHFGERGAPFVVGSDLGLRPESLLYSPNYPERSRA